MADLQSDINLIAAWVKRSDLCLNTQKTKLLLISRLRQPPPIVLTVDGSVVCKVPSVTYLGVSVSSDLSWTAHIDSVCSKAKRQVGLLHRQFHNASPTCKDQLYKSLVLPILDYCSSLWDPNYATHVSKLESVQKFAARFVTGRWSDNYDSLLSHLKWSKLSTRGKKQKLVMQPHFEQFFNTSTIPTTPLMSASWNLCRNLQPDLSPGDGLTVMTPCSATSNGLSSAPEERSRNLSCNRILNNCSILPPSLFIPHLRHNHHLLCTVLLVTQLPTYPHLLSVLYHCGIVYLLTLFVPPLILICYQCYTTVELFTC